MGGTQVGWGAQTSLVRSWIPKEVVRQAAVVSHLKRGGAGRKGNGYESAQIHPAERFGEHCAVQIRPLKARNTSLESPGPGGDDGITLTRSDQESCSHILEGNELSRFRELSRF